MPPALDAIALCALSPDPRARFQTAEDMKKALDDAIWHTRFGTSEIAAHMTAVFTDRMEARRTLLARATREQLSQRDLATFGSVFKDPASSVEPHGAVRALTTPFPFELSHPPAPMAAPPRGNK